MSAIKQIRKLLGLSQAALAEGIGCTQGNVSFYEKGQTVPPQVAQRLIEFAKSKGHALTYDDIYAVASEQADIARPADQPADASHVTGPPTDRATASDQPTDRRTQDRRHEGRRVSDRPAAGGRRG